MALDFGALIYKHCQTMFGRECVFTPLVSQPGGASYTRNGIFSMRPIMVTLEDGSIISDQGDTILDILKVDFPVPPLQGDQVNIPYDPASGLKAIGDFQIVDTQDNGGGEVTLTLRELRKAP